MVFSDPEPKENTNTNSKLSASSICLILLLNPWMNDLLPLRNMTSVCLSHKEIKMACLTKANMLSFMCVNADHFEMVVYFMSSDSRQICFASRNVYWGNVKFMLNCCLAVFCLVLLVHLFPFPKQPFVPVSIFCVKHLYLWTWVWLVCTALTSKEFHKKVIFAFMFSCASLCGEKNVEMGEDCF